MKIIVNWEQLKTLKKLINAYDGVEKEGIATAEIELHTPDEKAKVSWKLGLDDITFEMKD